MDIWDFFERRIEQDEEIARVAIEQVAVQDSRLTMNPDGRAGMTGRRLLAEVKLKRDLLDIHGDYFPVPEEGRASFLHCVTCKERYPCQSLRIALAVYADHPSYDPDWRPVDPDPRLEWINHDSDSP